MKKKTISLLLACTLTTGLLFTGCGDKEEASSTPPAQTETQTQETKAPEKTPEDEIKEGAEAFLSALDSGDMEKISSTATEDVLKSDNLKVYSFTKDFDDQMNDMMEGVDLDKLDTASQNTIKDFIASILDMLISSHSIVDVKADSDTSGTVTANITYSVDPSILGTDEFDMEDYDDLGMDQLLSDYIEKNKEEFEQMEKDGKSEEDMMIKFYNDLLPDMLDLMKQSLQKSVDKAEDKDMVVMLTMSKENGSWKVSGIKQDGASDSASSDAATKEDDDSNTKDTSSDSDDKSSEKDSEEASAKNYNGNQEVGKLAMDALDIAEQYQNGKIDEDEADKKFKPIMRDIEDITDYVEDNGYEKYSTSDLLVLTKIAGLNSDIAFIGIGETKYKEDLKDHIKELQDSLK